MQRRNIFRDVALARLSSPEQLDTLLRVTTPRNWMALTALIGLLGVGIAWGVKGTISTKTVGQGVVMRSGGVFSVGTLGSGRVGNIKVKEGDLVTVGQVIAMVEQPQLLEQIRVTSEQLRNARQQREALLKVRGTGVRLQAQALDKQRANMQQATADLQAQATLVQAQIPVDEELFEKGLITRQQTYASRQRLVEIQSNIANAQAKLRELDASQAQVERQSLEANLQLKEHILRQEHEVELLHNALEAQSKVISPYGGQVLEIKVAPGALVQAGTAILSIQPNVEALETVLYIPAEKAKQVQAGMPVEISPSTVKREEFGFIWGTVTYVAEYPTTEAALQKIFENASLARSLAAAGPVTEVRVAMQRDASTPSGFQWSSPRGAPVQITGGTLCVGQIVTREQRPISLVFPSIKDKLGLS